MSYLSAILLVVTLVLSIALYLAYKKTKSLRSLYNQLNYKYNSLQKENALVQKRLQHTSLLNEQWEDKMRQKNIELTKHIKDGEDKNRILTVLKDKLKEAEYNPKINKAYWAEMDRLLSIHLESNQDTFEMQIDELHQSFIKALHVKFPDLSVYDLRLCAYLKIGLNSKEISEILNVLPSSINVSRSRLRKKLGLVPEEDLFSFLNQIVD